MAESYAYDANGNRTGSGYVVGAGNRLQSDGTFNYTYDSEGNLVRKTRVATGEYTVFAYDHRNRLVRAEDRNVGGALLRQTAYTHDVFDRRIGKVAAGSATYYVYNGGASWADFNGAGAVTARYLVGPGTDEMIARHRLGEGRTWYLADRLGTVRDLANPGGTAVVGHYDYDSFGGVLAETNPAAGDRFRFTGREFDIETGLYHYRARSYDPVTGRFLREDPSGFTAGDANLYRYVGNSPTNATDPTGQAAAVQYAVKVAQFIGLRPQAAFEVKAPTFYEVQGSMVGFFAGFASATFFFVANIMEIYNTGGDIVAQWGTAVSRVKAQTEELKRVAGLLKLVSEQSLSGFVGGFLTGSGVKAGFKITLFPNSEAIHEAAGYKFRPIFENKIGGFQSGVETALGFFAELQPR